MSVVHLYHTFFEQIMHPNWFLKAIGERLLPPSLSEKERETNSQHILLRIEFKDAFVDSCKIIYIPILISGNPRAMLNEISNRFFFPECFVFHYTNDEIGAFNDVLMWNSALIVDGMLTTQVKLLQQ